MISYLSRLLRIAWEEFRQSEQVRIKVYSHARTQGAGIVNGLIALGSLEVIALIFKTRVFFDSGIIVFFYCWASYMFGRADERAARSHKTNYKG